MAVRLHLHSRRAKLQLPHVERQLAIQRIFLSLGAAPAMALAFIEFKLTNPTIHFDSIVDVLRLVWRDDFVLRAL